MCTQVKTFSHYIDKQTLPALTSGTSESRCSRVCLAFENSEARFWAIHGKMKDGTPCPPTEDGYKDARCVKGSCVVRYMSRSKDTLVRQ